jgi:hypothetical protein
LSSRRVLSTFGIAIRTIAAVGALAFPMWIGITSCAPVPPVMSAPPSVEKAVIGKTMQELLACTAVAPDEHTVGDVTELIFYKESLPLEESFPVSKGSFSFSKSHHGCLAHVELKEGRVQGMHYHAVPPSYPAYDHCDAIFSSCLGR